MSVVFGDAAAARLPQFRFRRTVVENSTAGLAQDKMAAPLLTVVSMYGEVASSGKTTTGGKINYDAPLPKCIEY